MPHRATLALALLVATPAYATDARIAIPTETTSIDPMFHNIGPNMAFSRNIFDTLIAQDDRQRLVPSLALAWTAIEPATWEIKLRPGVLFHDGTPFTADDVAFSLARAPNVPGSPSSFSMYTKAIATTEITDPLTIRIHTMGPSPLLPNDLSVLPIVSRHATEGRTTADFDAGTAAIGTGPYRFVRWDRGGAIALERNPAYWGPKQPWEHVFIRPISNGAARVAALLSGDVDLIEAVPSDAIERLAKDPHIHLFSTDSNRLIFLHMDSARDVTPGITDNEGRPLPHNPLRDRRVREAISIAINREALTTRLLNNQAKPAGQLLPLGFFGTSEKLLPPPYDPARAKQLLAEAGYPQGFRMVLAATNDRYPRDVEVAQAIAQMLARIGIAVQLDVMPSAMVFTRANRLDFSAMVLGWIAASGEATSPMVAILATFDPARGMGPSNRGRYSNQGFDRLLDEALHTLDETRRAALLAEATETAMHDTALAPLYFLVNTWATRPGFAYDARSDELTEAASLSAAP